MQEMKIKILRIILIILLIATFFIIFKFSNQNGKQSGSLSMEVTKSVTKNIQQIQKLENSRKEKVLLKIEKIIRKMAHFSLYALVGFLLMSLMSTYKLSKERKIAISLATGVLYAMSDELHQFFVSDRSAQVTDVIIDSIGVATGIALVILVLWIWEKIKVQKSTKLVEK